MAILRKTVELEVATRGVAQIPKTPTRFRPTDEDIKEVENLFDGDLRVPHNFKLTAPPETAYKPKPNFHGAYYYRNPQTTELCTKLQIPNLNEQLCNISQRVGVAHYLSNKRWIFLLIKVFTY